MIAPSISPAGVPGGTVTTIRYWRTLAAVPVFTSDGMISTFRLSGLSATSNFVSGALRTMIMIFVAAPSSDLTWCILHDVGSHRDRPVALAADDQLDLGAGWGDRS